MGEEYFYAGRKIGRRYIEIAGSAYTHYSKPEEGAQGQRKDSESS